jgi:hypothetical protein
MMQEICRHVHQLIDDLRTDLFLAVRLDEFVKDVNERIKIDAEERGIEAVEASERDVIECIKRYDDVKVTDLNDVKVLWLWAGWYSYYLIEKIADMAKKYRRVLAEPEKYDAE